MNELTISAGREVFNPFVGGRPLREEDEPRFFGREELSSRLSEAILGARCVTLYGQPGSGKTSLLLASVLPTLARSHDVRDVYIDAWPAWEDPIEVLSQRMHAGLLSGPAAEELSPTEAVLSAAKRAARASSRLVILCLDQIEQLLYPGRPSEPTERFLVCLEDLLELPLRPVRVILSIREDYLGRFLDMLRGRLRMMEQYFRVVPFNVVEMTEIACKLAAMGEPPQAWSPDELSTLIMEMRVHEQAATRSSEIRLSYAQTFCQALFERRLVKPLPDETSIKRELSPFIERTIADWEVFEGHPGNGEQESEK